MRIRSRQLALTASGSSAQLQPATISVKKIPTIREDGGSLIDALRYRRRDVGITHKPTLRASLVQRQGLDVHVLDFIFQRPPSLRPARHWEIRVSALMGNR